MRLTFVLGGIIFRRVLILDEPRHREPIVDRRGSVASIEVTADQPRIQGIALGDQRDFPDVADAAILKFLVHRAYHGEIAGHGPIQIHTRTAIVKMIGMLIGLRVLEAAFHLIAHDQRIERGRSR